MLLLWVGAVLVIRNYLADRASQSAGNDEVNEALTERVDRVVERVTSLYRSQRQITCQTITCAVPSNLSKPAILLSRTARTPAIAESATPPALVLPVRVVEELDDAELEGVVAHEMAHVVIDGNQQGCSPVWARLAAGPAP